MGEACLTECARHAQHEVQAHDVRECVQHHTLPTRVSHVAGRLCVPHGGSLPPVSTTVPGVLGGVRQRVWPRVPQRSRAGDGRPATAWSSLRLSHSQCWWVGVEGEVFWFSMSSVVMYHCALISLSMSLVLDLDYTLVVSIAALVTTQGAVPMLATMYRLCTCSLPPSSSPPSLPPPAVSAPDANLSGGAGGENVRSMIRQWISVPI